jgi:hypothetical protein
MDKLSSSLKNDLIFEINRNIMSQCTLLNSNFDRRFLYQITLILQEKIYIPEEVVFKVNIIYNKYFF